MPAARTIVLSKVNPSGIHANLVVACRPESEQASAYRLLAHQVLQRGPDKAVVLITSARPKSGKTVCAANLALALGELSEAKPVLLDGNFRAPGLANLFHFEPPQSLRMALLGDPLAPMKLAQLDDMGVCIAALHPAEPPARLRDPAPLVPLLRDLRLAGFGPILVDGPHALGGAEANLLLDHCDGALIVARSGEVRARDIEATQAQLGADRLHGLVLLDA